MYAVLGCVVKRWGEDCRYRMTISFYILHIHLIPPYVCERRKESHTTTNTYVYENLDNVTCLLPGQQQHWHRTSICKIAVSKRMKDNIHIFFHVMHSSSLVSSFPAEFPHMQYGSMKTHKHTYRVHLHSPYHSLEYHQHSASTWFLLTFIQEQDKPLLIELHLLFGLKQMLDWQEIKYILWLSGAHSLIFGFNNFKILPRFDVQLYLWCHSETGREGKGPHTQKNVFFMENNYYTFFFFHFFWWFPLKYFPLLLIHKRIIWKFWKLRLWSCLSVEIYQIIVCAKLLT